MDLQHLADVHAGRHAQRVQHDVQRGAVRQERHILHGQDAGNDALVAVAAGHFVADLNLALLRDIAPHDLVDPGAQLVVAVLAGKDLHVHHDAVFAVGDAQRGVADLARLLAENRAQQALLCGQLGLALRRDLADQDVARADLGADADDAAVVQVPQQVFVDVRDVAGDFLGAELGVAGLRLILLDMDGGEHVVADHPLAHQDGVLVIVALPGHEADQHVPAEADFAVLGRRPVGDDLAGLHMLIHIHNGDLIDTCSLVGAHKLGNVVGVGLAVFRADLDFVGGDAAHDPGVLGEDAHAGIHARLVLHARADDGGLGLQQGNRLPLHVGAHQRAVRVVVLQERNHRRRDGNDHPGRNVHEVRPLALHLHELVAVAAVDLRVQKMPLLVQRLVGLHADVVVLDVRRHIDDFLGDDAGLFIHAAERRLDEAVLVDAGEGRKVGNQADVGAFRRLDWAHAAVVGVVHVADLKPGAVPRKAARPQRGEAALVRELRQGVGLVHELREGRGAEELADGRRDGADVDQRMGREGLQILRLQGHALADHALQTGKADAELVLQQLAHRADAPVAQMVDVVQVAEAHRQAVQIIDGGEDVVDGDVAGDEVVPPGADLLLALVIRLAGIQNLLEHAEPHALPDAAFLLRVEIDVFGDVDHPVGDDPHLFVVLDFHRHRSDARVVHLFRKGAGNRGAGLGHHLARGGVGDRAREHLPGKAAGQVQLLVVLVAPDAGKVVAPGVEKQAVQVGLRTLDGGGLARPQFAVNLEKGFLHVLAGVLLDGGGHAVVVAEEIQNLLVRAEAQRPDEHRDRDFAVLVDAHVKDVVGVGLVLQPRAAVRDHRGAVQLLAGLVVLHFIIDARRADQLGNNHALRAVHDECAAVRHQGEVAHIDFRFLDFAAFLIEQPRRHAQRGGISGVPDLALLHAVVRLVGIQLVIDKVQHEVAGIVGNAGNFPEHFLQAFVQKPLIGFLLYLYQIGHIQDLIDPGEAHSGILADLYRFDIHHRLNHSNHRFYILRSRAGHHSPRPDPTTRHV